MRLVIGFGKPRNPILGMVFAGDVDSAGSAVRRFQPGDAVFGWTIKGGLHFGTYAEYKCLPEDSVIAIKPPNLSYEDAAALPYGGLLALHFLRQGGISSGQKVLIYGASGAIGTAAVQLARYFGAHVTGVCSTANLEMVQSLGAQSVIDYTKENALAAGQRYDLILDAVGTKKSSSLKDQCRQALAPNGKYVSVDDRSPNPGVDDLAFLQELAAAGHLQAVIDRCYPLEQMAEAHRYADQGHKRGNIVITVR